jgi:hypothetical protein
MVGNGKRKRVFFRAKADAETWAYHNTVEATNYENCPTRNEPEARV